MGPTAHDDVGDGEDDRNASDANGGSYEVVLVRRTGPETVLDVAPTESVLEAAERTGRCLPFGCRRGTCASCTGRVLGGDVEHRREPRALKDHHLQDGYVLTCIAQPRGDCRIEVGAEVGRDLVENPWK